MGPHYDAAIRQQEIIAAELRRLDRHPADRPDTARQVRTLLGIAAVLLILPTVCGS